MATRLSRLLGLVIIVAACAQVASPSPSPEAPTAFATVEPTPLATTGPSPSGTPIPSPTSTPGLTPAQVETPVSADIALERFIEFSSGDRPFHLFMDASFEGVVAGDPGRAAIEMDGDVLGDDFDGSLVMTAPGVTIEADVIAVDGVSYVRPLGGGWEESGDLDQTQPLNPVAGPVAGLDADDVTYAGGLTRSGRALHRLSINEWTGASLRQLGIRRGSIELSVFEVLVDNDGQPVEAELQFSINGRFLGEALSFSYDVRYEFSNVGQPVVIEPPI